MSKRVTTVLVVLATLAWGTTVLHAQSLSPEQKEKLDSRFQHIVQKANQGTLDEAIDRFSKKVDRLQRKTESNEQNLKAQKKRLRTGEAIFPRDNSTALERVLQDLRPTTRRSGNPVYGAIVRTENPSALESTGVQVGSSFDTFATVYATPGELAELSKLSAVTQIRSPRKYEPQNDEAAAEVGARTLNHGVGGTKYTGKDVMTCIIDSGIDWDHPDFTDENGRSRIRYIWDQVGDAPPIKPPSANNPSRFGPDFNAWYGDEYMPRHIRSGNVFEVDQNGHGTHVAGTATSSGMAYKQSHGVKKYQGMAPDADIVAVKTRFTSVGIIDGINYCKSVAKAEGKPVVVNMSLGTPFGPHDGTSPLAKATEALTKGGTASGMAVVASAGNSGSPRNPIHTGPMSLATGDSADVEVEIPDTESGFLDFFSGDVWLYAEQSYNVSVYTPEMRDTLTVDVKKGRFTADTLTTDQGRAILYSFPGFLGQKRNLQLLLIGGSGYEPAPSPAAGTWTLRVRSDGSTRTKVHGWSTTNIFSFTTGESAAFANADNQYTLGSPATSKGAIAVGSYTHRTRWSTVNGAKRGFQASTSGVIRDSISSFSSRGPTVDGRQKPAITAPGQIMISSLSGDARAPRALQVSKNHWGLQGTSMSAPTVSGSVALLMQEDPTLSTDRVRNLLTETARVDEAVQARGGAWNRSFGYGKLNVLRALMELRQSTQDPKKEVLAYEDPFDFRSGFFTSDESTTDSIGADGAKGLALRFTPTMSGFFSGAYVSVGANQVKTNSRREVTGIEEAANELTDSVRVQVYTDDGGVPGNPMGEPVMVPPKQFGLFTPNFIDFNEAGVAVKDSTDYHLVLKPGDNENGDLEILAETAEDNSGRSMRKKGSSWSSTGNDLVIRAEVTGTVSAPPAVAGASVSTAEPQNVQIGWNAVDGASKYHVFRDTQPLPRSTSGLTPLDTVQASTTTYTDDGATAGWTYYYRVAAVDENGTEGEASSQVQAFLYPQNVTANISRSFGSAPAGESGASYRLVAMPGTADKPLQETLDGKAGLDWQAYAQTSSGLVKFDGSDTFTLSAGNGFWLSSSSTWSSSAEVSTVQLQGDSAATVSLNDGWNIVSNPTGKDVPFSMIQAAHSDTLQRPMGWDGSWYVADTMHSARSGMAYYFNNTEGLDALTIPYPGSPHVGSKAAPKTAKESPALALSARSTATGSPASTVKIDFRPKAANGLDARDLIAPTDHFEAVSLRLRAPAPSASGQHRDLLVEQRSPITASAADGQTFDLQLRSTVSGPVQISVRNLAAVKDHEVALIHAAAGRTYDLRRKETVTITPSGETTSLKLAVGSQAYVEGRTDDVVPEKVTLSSYPNPFRQQATVKYTLPEAQEVRLVLYDVLGREVAVLESGRKEEGRHEVRLNADELASGVYFGRLKAGNKQLTKKITVVR